MTNQLSFEAHPPTRQRLRLLLLRAAGLVLSTLPSSTTRALAQGRRVIVLRPDHLGDVLLSRPALALLRAALPDGALTVAVGPWGAPSLQGLGVQPLIFPFPGFTRRAQANPLAPYADLLAFAAQLRRGRYDAALVLRPDHWWGALACAIARVPIRVGRALPETAPFLTHSRATAPLQSVVDAALEDAQAVLDALGLPGPSARPSVAFEATRAAGARADAWLAAHLVGWQGRHPRGSTELGFPLRLQALPGLVAIHPGSGAPIKLWPAQRWVQVAEALAAHATIILTAGPDELALARRIQGLMSPPLPLAADLSWDDLAALYQRVDLVVGMDSGPLHLAQAVGRPTVRLYGPSDPRLYGPLAGGATPQYVLPIAGGLPCAPCGDFVAPPCGYHFDPPCLAAIRVDEVVAAALESLARNSLPPGGGGWGRGGSGERTVGARPVI